MGSRHSHSRSKHHHNSHTHHPNYSYNHPNNSYNPNYSYNHPNNSYNHPNNSYNHSTSPSDLRHPPPSSNSSFSHHPPSSNGSPSFSHHPPSSNGSPPFSHPPLFSPLHHNPPPFSDNPCSSDISKSFLFCGKPQELSFTKNPPLPSPTAPEMRHQTMPSHKPSTNSLASNAVGMDANVEYAECPLCYDDLYKDEQAVFTIKKKRICQHFLHKKCADLVAASKRQCPICRRQFDGVLSVPDVSVDPKGWFRVVDKDQNGRLDVKEVVEALKAVLPIDWRVLEASLPRLWPTWDKDGSGTIDMAELIHPDKGLYSYVRAKIPHRIDRGEAPDFYRNADAWFRFWDEDHSGALDREEVVRALVKTFRLSPNLANSSVISELLDVLWGEFDADNNGMIDLEEFSRSNGLAETIRANLALL